MISKRNSKSQEVEDDKKKENDLPTNNNDINANANTFNGDYEDNFFDNTKRNAPVIRTGGGGRYHRVKIRPGFEDQQLKDNSYDGRDRYASKAYRDFSKVKGKNFTKEKNKKKEKYISWWW